MIDDNQGLNSEPLVLKNLLHKTTEKLCMVAIMLYLSYRHLNTRYLINDFQWIVGKYWFIFYWFDWPVWPETWCGICIVLGLPDKGERVFSFSLSTRVYGHTPYSIFMTFLKWFSLHFIRKGFCVSLPFQYGSRCVK